MILAAVYSEHISTTPTMSYNRPYTKTEFLNRRTAAFGGKSFDNNDEALLAANDFKLIADPDIFARFQPDAVHANTAELDIVLRQSSRFKKSRCPKPPIQPY